MKIPIRPINFRSGLRHLAQRFRWVAFGGFVVIALVSVIYATTPALLTNTAQTTAAGVPTLATGAFTSSTVCNASSGVYSSNTNLNWGSVPAGTTQAQFVCLQNGGTGNYKVPTNAQLNATMCAGCGTVTSPQAQLVVPPHSFLLVELDWAVSASVPPGTQNWTITFS